MKLIVANWKMHKTSKESVAFIKAVKTKKTKHIMILCPPFTSLQSAKSALGSSKIKLGAQDMYFQEEGPFTGEISANMLAEFGVVYVLLGHSERRLHCHENNEMIKRKVQAALAHNLTPILCVGEQLAERDDNRTAEALKIQLAECLSGIKTTNKVIVAYEPVWCIGTGKNPTAKEIEYAHEYLRELSSLKAVLYGGSVNSKNAKEILALPSVDGVLVGGASLDPKQFLEIANS